MIGLGFKEKMIKLLNKIIRDELSASIFYAKASNELVGPESSDISKELMEHSKEEMEHFNRLLKFASSHGFMKDIKIELDQSVIDFSPLKDVKIVIAKVQELERIAIDDYTKAAMCAKKHGSIEGKRFFTELMREEIDHFDDFSYVNGDSRPLVGLSGMNMQLIQKES